MSEFDFALHLNFLSAAILLFLVLDPLGNIPVFLTVLHRVEHSKKWRVVLRESLIAYFVLIFFFFCGKYILRILGLDESALGVAGGVILFIIAIRMIFSGVTDSYIETSGEPFIVPLAIPLIAGPSAIATVLLFMANSKGSISGLFFAITLAWAASTFILVSSSIFNKFLGKRGLIALERLMGMILTTIAVQMLLNGIASFLSRHS